MTFAIAALVFMIDRIAKSATISALQPGSSMQIAPGLFHITLVHNTGAAFGIFRGGARLFIAASILAIAAISSYAIKNKNAGKPVYVALGLVLGGAAGNLFDRLTLGYVIDFLDFRVWPVFNIADASICIGVFLILLGFFRKREVSKNSLKKPELGFFDAVIYTVTRELRKKVHNDFTVAPGVHEESVKTHLMAGDAEP